CRREIVHSPGARRGAVYSWSGRLRPAECHRSAQAVDRLLPPDVAVLLGPLHPFSLAAKTGGRAPSRPGTSGGIPPAHYRWLYSAFRPAGRAIGPGLGGDWAPVRRQSFRDTDVDNRDALLAECSAEPPADHLSGH